MKKIFFVFGVLFFGIGVMLHFYFSSLDIAYIETFSNQLNCKVYLSQISDNMNKSLEDNCPVQIHLLQSVFVKLFLGLGILLIIAESFLAYSKIEKK